MTNPCNLSSCVIASVWVACEHRQISRHLSAAGVCRLLCALSSLFKSLCRIKLLHNLLILLFCIQKWLPSLCPFLKTRYVGVFSFCGYFIVMVKKVMYFSRSFFASLDFVNIISSFLASITLYSVAKLCQVEIKFC